MRNSYRFLLAYLSFVILVLFTLNGLARADTIPVIKLRRVTNSVSSGFSVPSLAKDYILTVDTSGGGVTITLPDAVASDGCCIDMKNIGSPASAVSVAPLGLQKIDGFSSDALTVQNESRKFCAVSGNWFNY